MQESMTTSIKASNSQTLDQIVNLAHYPIDRQDSEDYHSLVDSAVASLNSEQVYILPNFLVDSSRLSEIEMVLALQDQANPAHSMRNVYLHRDKTPDLPDDHPKNIMAEGQYKMIGAHILPNDSDLKALYFNPYFQQFVTDITDSEKLYPSDDPYQPVNVICYGDGDQSAWHFDSGNAFTMTLMLQAPELGGDFEIVPNIRSDDNPNIDELRTMLLGDRSRVKSYQRQEGALVIFRGCHSAHRVTQVQGNKKRLMCVMVYEKQPGVIGDPIVNETVYGVKP